LSLNSPRTAISFLVLECSETRKSMDQVLAVCERAMEDRLARRSQMLCVGGGVASDVVGLAATLFRRGIPHINVPTTLIGMIDAGIGVKNAVNFGGCKSLLGTFSAPEVSLIDPSFLATLPRRHLQCGLAEMIKIAVMCSAELFALIEARADRLLEEDVGMPLHLAEELIELTVEWTLKELELNLFERSERFDDTYARKLDFGHTFSPHIEVASQHRVLHGEAVAIDIAVSTELAHSLGILDEPSRARVLDVLRRVGLPVYATGMDPAAMHASLKSVIRHRDGHLNLALPTGIGGATFLRALSDVSPVLLDEVWQRLSRLSLESVVQAERRGVF
jgi:3-dehydroquinate synthase